MNGLLKHVLPSSLLGRSLLILITPLLLVQAVTTYMFFNRHWEKIVDRMAFSVAGEIAVLANQIEANDDDAYIAHLTQMLHENLHMNLAYFPGARLHRISAARDFDTHMTQALFRAVTEQVRRQVEINPEAREKWVEINVQLRNGTISVLVPERRLFSSSGYVVLLWMLGTSLILLAIAVLFMRNQIRPIRRLAIAAERFGKGRDVPFFKAEGAREVRQAARAFLEMRARIDRQIAQRTALLAGVSHDLRTPLTRMKLQVAMMPEGPDKTDLQSDIADMQKMIDAYLQFARGEGEEEAERVDIRALLLRVVDAARREGAQITFSAEEGISLMLRPVAIERCFANLIGNAVKYAPHAWVTLYREKDEIVVLIDDDGAGIPGSLHDDVFKPFFRGEQSRNTKTGGVGLGMPIAQDVIHSHGGEITLSDSPHGGLRVAVSLPV